MDLPSSNRADTYMLLLATERACGTSTALLMKLHSVRIAEREYKNDLWNDLEKHITVTA